MRRLFIVPLEEVGAEVVFQVAPDGVDMVGGVLDVVVFQEESSALDAVVVPLARLNRPGPREVNFPPTVGFDLLPVGGGEFGAVAAEVFFDQGGERFALGRGEFGGDQAGGFKAPGFALGAGEDVAGSSVGDDGHGALLWIEGFHELPAEVLLGGEDAQSGTRTGTNFGRVCPKEGRGGGEDVLAARGEVQAQVVTLEAESPVILSRRAEQADVIQLGVAARRLILQVEEDLLKAHDGGGFEIAGLTERGAEQIAGKLALGRSHFGEGQALARHRDEIPVPAFVAAEFMGGLDSLRGCERREEIRRSSGHFGRRRVRLGNRGKELKAQSNGEQAAVGFHGHTTT